MNEAKAICLNDGHHVYLGDYNLIINHELQEHFLNNSRDRFIDFKDIEINECEIKKGLLNLRSMCFEITRDCNLKCRYCVYNGSYSLYQSHRKGSLTFETARQSLDYIYSLIGKRGKKEFAVSFYGGEPLLRFELIKKIIEYTKSLFRNWKLLFTVTTNGTLINREIIDFFAANECIMTVSLDGSRLNHDAKRVFKNGRGSHEIIMKNLKLIREVEPEYFFTSTHLYAVFSKDLNFKDSFNFFINNGEINSNPVRWTFVDEFGTGYYNEFPYDKKKVSGDYHSMIESLKKKVIKKNKLSPIELSMIRQFGSMTMKLANKNVSSLASSCFFDNKLFIDSGGNFHICEKMNDKFSIGDASSGFNFGKIEEIARAFTSEIKKRCTACSLKALCERCFVFLARDGYFEIDDHFCEQRQRSIVKDLDNFIRLKEGQVI